VAKTNKPATIEIEGKTIRTNALPDPFDALDLQYRPKLQLLPNALDARAGQVVLDQLGQSCTGHAVAALIDTVLSTPLLIEPEHGPPRVPTTHVSPYMLYALARKYDEYPGTDDIGSSLRGALKGWYHHGVCSADRWKFNTPEPDIYDPEFVAECLRTPLGAYYRVNARRIDDMQSALTELNGIAASAAIHEGWLKPRRQGSGASRAWVIQRSGSELGGHAFLIAGYNDTGFLIQNSWGTTWGRNGYATLPYEDWQDNAYDAWVARPGVPQGGVQQKRRKVIPAGASFVVGTGPDVSRLKSYVINVTAGGKLSPKGLVTSDPFQIKAMAATMATDIEAWAKPAAGGNKRRLVLYAHGGLVGEKGGIEIADRMIDWWRSNHIYPIHIIWESDAITTILSFLEQIRDSLPFGGIRDGIFEAADRLIEGAGRNIQQLWAEMKTNARMASGPRGNTSEANAPGVTLFVGELKKYLALHPDLEIHLVGHSAGSVALAGVVGRLADEKITVDSLQLMGGAITVDEFERDVLKHLAGVTGSTGKLRRFTAYDLQDKSELDDVCPGPPIPAVYHKSLLYFVARALEPSPKEFEEAMVGLSKSMLGPMPSNPSKRLVDLIGGSKNLVLAPNNAVELDSRSKARGHGDFDNDEDTMTSVVLRILKKSTLDGVHPYPKGGMPTG
jgi:hypothetical protein